VVDLVISIAAAMLLAWLALVLVLIVARPRGGLLREALRVLPDVLRLVRRLAADKTLPRGEGLGRHCKGDRQGHGVTPGSLSAKGCGVHWVLRSTSWPASRSEHLVLSMLRIRPASRGATGPLSISAAGLRR